MYYGCFYLDKEKDLIVSLYKDGEEMSYVLSTPNHNSGNLIRNLAKLCDLPLSYDDNGLLVIRGRVPCYITAYNEEIYIFRLGGTKVANIYPDGRIEMKASIPSLSKTLMSQTKDYQLDIAKTIIKTYIFRECKFRTDLHTHMNANLAPDLLIALGIYHQIRYPLYYIRKLGLIPSKEQAEKLARQRKKTAKRYQDSALTGKYLDRKIDDNTFINFAELILRNLENAEHNIPRIRACIHESGEGVPVPLCLCQGTALRSEDCSGGRRKDTGRGYLEGASADAEGPSECRVPGQYHFPGQAPLDCQELCIEGHSICGDL